jgi:hypothetical protein
VGRIVRYGVGADFEEVMQDTKKVQGTLQCPHIAIERIGTNRALAAARSSVLNI